MNYTIYMRMYGFLALFLLSVAPCAYSQVAVPDSVLKQVDDCLSRDAAAELAPVLEKSAASVWYPRLESYLLRRARQMVIENRLDTAKSIALALVDANLDNMEALDLYQSVQKAIVKRDESVKRAAETEAAAAYKEQVVTAKIKQEAEKTYQTVTNTSTGKKVYLDQDFNVHYRDATWDLRFGLVNIGFESGTPDGNAIKYGLSADGSFFYHGENYSAGGEAGGTVMILSLAGNRMIDWRADAILSLAKNSISKYAVLRAGFSYLNYDLGDETIEALSFPTPVAGFGFRDLPLGKTGRLQLSFDYYPGHLTTDDIETAFGVQMLSSFVLADMQSFNVHFYPGLTDTVLSYKGTFRNDIKIILAIGVGDYE